MSELPGKLPGLVDISPDLPLCQQERNSVQGRRSTEFLPDQHLVVSSERESAGELLTVEVYDEGDVPVHDQDSVPLLTRHVYRRLPFLLASVAFYSF